MPNIKALRIEPGTTPIETCLGTSLKELQAAVDGYIEMVPLDKACNILCNEDQPFIWFRCDRRKVLCSQGR